MGADVLLLFLLLSLTIMQALHHNGCHDTEEPEDQVFAYSQWDMMGEPCAKKTSVNKTSNVPSQAYAIIYHTIPYDTKTHGTLQELLRAHYHIYICF